MTTTAAWEANADAATIAAWLKEQKSVAVLTHGKPDGDAVGSTMAAVRALHRVGVDAMPWYSEPVPRWLPDLAGGTPFKLVEHDGLPSADAALVLDTGSWNQLEAVRPWLEGKSSKAALIDHHLRGDGDAADMRLIDTSAAAACQLAADLAACLLDCAKTELPQDIAEACYLGTATDTGWFKHSNVSPRVLRDAADLLQAGVDHSRLFQLTEQRDRPARLALMGRSLSSLTFHAEGAVAIQSLTEQDFEDTGASPGDSGGFVDQPMTVDAVRVSAVLTEIRAKDGSVLTKISMRSKEGPRAVDVNQVAGTLGGGGHARASGARVAGDVAEVLPRLLQELSTAMGMS
ncbi:MAG: DHH family phosphoesterase [Planctomycetota bacterium]